MNVELTKDEILAAVADRFIKEHAGFEFVHALEEQVQTQVNKLVTSKLDEIGRALIDKAVENMTENWRTLKLRRTNNWGEPQGEQVTLPTWIEDQLTARDVFAGKDSIRKLRDSIENIVRSEAKALVNELKPQMSAIVTKSLADAVAKGTR